MSSPQSPDNGSGSAGAPAAGEAKAGERPEVYLAVIPDRFRVTGLLGRGGMGAVFAARDRILGREVAIKCLPPALAGDATTRARFLREARAAATLRHPGVVQVYDVDPDARFLVMELVDGESLAVRIRRSRLTAAEARRLGAALLDTLAAAHAAGVVHRDVKPANILLEPDGTPRLADFGIAIIEGDPELTSANQRLGTPAYTAPEQLRGLRVDGRADQFAVAATLFKALVGRGPFADPDSAAAGPRAALESVTGDAGLAAAVERALAERPEDRFPDAAAFAAALRADDTTGHGPEEAGAPTLETPLALLPEVEAPASTPDVPSPRRARPWVVGGCLAALALGLGFGARFIDDPPPAAPPPAATPPEPIAAPTPPKGPASPLERARAALEAGDTEGAGALLAPLTLSAPNDPEATLLRLIHGWWSARPRPELAARVEAARAASGATDRRALIDAIDLAIRDGHASAVEAFRAVAQRMPDEPFAAYGLFEALYHAGRPIEALRVYRAMADAHPGFALGLLHLGEQYVARGDEQGMRWLLDRTERLTTPANHTLWTARVLAARHEYAQAAAVLARETDALGDRVPPDLDDLTQAVLVLDGQIDQVLDRAERLRSHGVDTGDVLLSLALARGDAALATQARAVIAGRSVQGERARFEQAWILGAMAIEPADPPTAAALLAGLTDAVARTPEVAVRGHIVRLLLARAAGDPSVATALLESPLPDVRAVAMALVAEARGDLEAAARHWTEAIDGASSTRVLSLVGFQRARVAAALGRSETVLADCEQVIRPGQFEWTWGELVGPCLVMTAQAQLALSRPEQARDTLRRLAGLRRAAPSQDPLLREAAALQARLP
jgi:serine/threonine protein kinase/tetratricopeptide (TPR) repeat protein